MITLYARYPRYSFVQAQGAMTATHTQQPVLRSDIPNPPMYSATEPCPADPDFCLPISSENNLRFHLFLDDLYDTLQLHPSIDHINNTLCFALPVPTDSTTGTPPAMDPYRGLLLGNHYTPGSLVTAASPNLSVNFDRPIYSNTLDTEGIDIGECFKFMIICCPRDASNNYLGNNIFCGYTNCFQRVDAKSLCYTSLVTYWNNPYNDSFDFDYIDGLGYANMVELPIYLRDPIMENDQKVYTKSDGSLVKLYERKEEVYQMETDLMPYAWHKALDIALSHDNLYITSPNATGFDPVNTAQRFVKKDNYEIEYNKTPLSSLGKGSCKISNANPIHLINNNCA